MTARVVAGWRPRLDGERLWIRSERGTRKAAAGATAGMGHMDPMGS